MKRRNLFKFIPMALLPFYRGMASGGQDHSSLPASLGLKPLKSEKYPLPLVERDHLAEWMNAPRHPVLHPEPPNAWYLAMAARHNRPMVIRYHGGSTPGAKRTVVPAQVFTVGESRILYLSAWCMNKEAHRTFRIDRMELFV